MSEDKKRKRNDLDENIEDSILDYLSNFPLIYKSIQLSQYISKNELFFDVEHITILKNNPIIFYNEIYLYISQLLMRFLGDFCNINDFECSEDYMGFILYFKETSVELIEDENDVLERCGILICELNKWLSQYSSKNIQISKFNVKAECNMMLFQLDRINV